MQQLPLYVIIPVHTADSLVMNVKLMDVSYIQPTHCISSTLQ